MGRQTRRDSTGKAFFKPADPDCASCRNCDRLAGCMGRWAEALAAYEDTGLTPEEIGAVTGLASRNCSQTADAIDALLAEDAELQAFRASGLTPDDLPCAAELFKAEKEGRIQSMSCDGCQHEQTGSLEEHRAHCLRCIRNRYPEDHYTRAEAEAALAKENRPN